MTKLIKAKTGKLNLGDAFLIAGAKVASERLLQPLVGDANFMSGGVKLGLSFLFSKMIGGKAGDIIGTALVVDGTEDIVAPFLNRFLGGGNGGLLSMGGQSGDTL